MAAIAVLVVVNAASRLTDDRERFVDEIWLAVMRPFVAPRAASTLLEDIERLFD